VPETGWVLKPGPLVGAEERIILVVGQSARIRVFSPSLRPLDGRLVLVTGTSRRIATGAAVARQLVADGAGIMLNPGRYMTPSSLGGTHVGGPRLRECGQGDVGSFELNRGNGGHWVTSDSNQFSG
jgi:hypothetical protein